MSDMPSVCREVERTARKAHRCCECREIIEPGEKYQYVSGVWDGRGDSFKTCLRCALVRRIASRHAEYHDEGPCFELLAQWILDEFSYVGNDTLDDCKTNAEI